MKIYQHLTVLFLLCCALSMLTGTEAKRDRKKKGKGRKRNDGSKASRTREMNKFYTCPLSCPRNLKRKPCFDSQSEGKTSTGIVFTRGAVEDSLNSTRAMLDDLYISLDTLTKEMSYKGKDNVSPGISMKELNPLEKKTRLASDEKFKLLGQMTWWLNWMGASFEVVQEISQRSASSKRSRHRPTVPNVTDSNNRTHTISSVTALLRKLQRSVSVLRSQVGFKEDGKKGRQLLSKCQRVRVMQVCSEDSGCAKERDRAYVVLRDARRAVDRMREALGAESCGVEEVGDGVFSLGACQNRSIFYKLQCVQRACALQKMECKQCLSWGYV